jgi:hypothetical protein
METPRFDPYTLVHKGQRKKLFEITTALGQLGADEHGRRAELIEDLELTLRALVEHAEAEDAYFGPLYRELAPETAARIADEHARLHVAIGSLRSVVASSSAVPNVKADLSLYRAVARFTAAYVAHLDAEEGSLPELWAKVDDAEIAKAQGALVASHAPATVAFNLRNMMPAASRAERVAFLSSLRKTMPPGAFAGVRALVGPNVSEQDWARIEGY